MKQKLSYKAIATFEEWKKKVDQVLWKRAGVTSDDLPDFSYQAFYDCRKDAKETALIALRKAQNS